MPQPATVSDAPVGQTVNIGSQVIHFPTAGDLIAEEITFTKPLASVEFQDELGRDSESAYSTKKGRGSMTVQFKASGAVIGAGEIFYFVFEGGFNIYCIITSIGNVFSQGSAAKISVEFCEYQDGSVLPPNIATILPKNVFYDGPVGTAKACGPIRILPNPIPFCPSAVVAKQKWRVLETSYSKTPLGTAGPVILGQNTLLVDESELEDVGVAGMVTFEKTWASVPASWSLPVSVAKQYQSATYLVTWNNPPTINDMGVNSWTKVITGVMTCDYYPTAATVGAMPQLKVLQLKTYFQARELTDMGTGFPLFTYQNPAGGSSFVGYGTNQNDYSFISGSIEPYMGLIMCRKTIFGT